MAKCTCGWASSWRGTLPDADKAGEAHFLDVHASGARTYTVQRKREVE